MKANYLLLDLAVCGGLLASVELACAQTWTLTSAPSTNWVSVTSSADGTKLAAAVSGGPVFTSTNSEETWTQTSAPIMSWNTVASSADGTVLVAADDWSGIWISTSSGSVWAAGAALPISMRDCRAASSADGTKIVASGDWFDGGGLLTSTNSGTAWATFHSLQKYWRGLASSADGTKQFAGNLFCWCIWTSTNVGLTWTSSQTPFHGAWFLACSADGNKIIASGNGTWVSADWGATWTYTGLNGGPVACSADGTKLVTAKADGIFTSTNFGVTWISNNAPGLNWSAVASSADGCKLVAAVDGGGIYTCQITPTPILNAAPSEGELLLSWVIPSQSFVLQQSAKLATSNWTEVTNTSVLNLTNLQNQVVVPISSSSQFFRLKSL